MPIETKPLDSINHDDPHHESQINDANGAPSEETKEADGVFSEETIANGANGLITNGANGLRVDTGHDGNFIPPASSSVLSPTSSSSSVLSPTSPNIVSQGLSLGLRCQMAGTSFQMPNVTGPLSINAVCQAAARSTAGGTNRFL